MLKETLEYRRDAGEDLGEILHGYFPRVIEPLLVAKDPKRFNAACGSRDDCAMPGRGFEFRRNDLSHRGPIWFGGEPF